MSTRADSGVAPSHRRAYMAQSISPRSEASAWGPAGRLLQVVMGMLVGGGGGGCCCCCTMRHQWLLSSAAASSKAGTASAHGGCAGDSAAVADASDAAVGCA
eukprot:1143533-Pelagomonas_calceolata.AAC.4